jgi:hypothetical protein
MTMPNYCVMEVKVLAQRIEVPRMRVKMENFLSIGVFCLFRLLLYLLGNDLRVLLFIFYNLLGRRFICIRRLALS